VARGYLPPDELHRFYSKHARSCEAKREWQDAEKAYVAADEVDMAINMYKVNKMWLPLLKLVQQHRREQLPQMHLLVAHVSPVTDAGYQAAVLMPTLAVNFSVRRLHAHPYGCHVQQLLVGH
jgi:hypothetical protein